MAVLTIVCASYKAVRGIDNLCDWHIIGIISWES